MSSPPSPGRWHNHTVQQPLPISRHPSQSHHAIALLERSAEQMSLHSDSSSRYHQSPTASFTPRSRQLSYEDYARSVSDSLNYRSSFVHNDAPNTSLSASHYAPRPSDRFEANHSQSAVNYPHYLTAQQSHAQSSVARVPSTASGSTLRQAGSLFKDFDGTHYVPPPSISEEGNSLGYDAYEEALRRIEAEAVAESDIQRDAANNRQPTDEAQAADPNESQQPRIDILPSKQQNTQWVEPPPAEGMVYYPAPVPIKLNRPQRLSQMPSLAVSAQRRSKVLSTMNLEAKESAVWLGTTDAPRNNDLQDGISEIGSQKPKARQSALNMQKLPPQLRASVFFEQPSVQHQIRVKNGSAVETLDSLLDASAKAPRNATVAETLRKAMKDLDDQPKQSSKFSLGSDSATKSRWSFFHLKSASSSDKLQKLSPRKTLNEQPEEEEEDDDDDGDAEDSSINNERALLADHTSSNSQDSDSNHDDERRDEHDDREGSEDRQSQLDEEDSIVVADEQTLGAPTTLLAELQLRKQEQKSRTRTAATAFPNGMHSTLLQLDAVAQIEQKRRQTQRTALAWEDPEIIATSNQAGTDEEVPLGVLFPGKNGLVNHGGGDDWDRPLGLLEKKELEEHEPLSKRRNRLKGIKPQTASQKPSPLLEAPSAEPESEHEDETLAQRTRRLKSTKALNDAIGNASGEEISKDFADVISQFAVPEAAVENQGRHDNSSPGDGEEETLGQRRLRLLAEGRSRDVSSESKPEDVNQNGLANLLAENPIGNIRQVSGESSFNGLLRQNESDQAQRRIMMQQQNDLGSFNTLNSPLNQPNLNPNQSRMTTSRFLVPAQSEADFRWQQMYGTAQRSAVVGTEAHFIGHPSGDRRTISGSLLDQSENERLLRHHQINQHNAWGTTANRGDIQRDTRQSGGLTRGRIDDVSSNLLSNTTRRATSQFPHQQSQSNLLSQGFGNSGFGISPRHMSSSYVGASSLGYQNVGGAYQMQTELQFPSAQVQPAYTLNHDTETLSSKQRDSIDRWRQSIRH